MGMTTDKPQVGGGGVAEPVKGAGGGSPAEPSAASTGAHTDGPSGGRRSFFGRRSGPSVRKAAPEVSVQAVKPSSGTDTMVRAATPAPTTADDVHRPAGTADNQATPSGDSPTEAARAAGAADTAKAAGTHTATTAAKKLGELDTESALSGKVGSAEAPKPRLPTTRPPGAPPDPWTAFASTPERAPGRIRRAVRAVGRVAIHEYTLVVVVSIAVAVLMTWPTLRYPLHTIPQDTWNPTMQAWQLAWSGHILLTDPMQLWQSNAFFGERYSFAFADSLLGYAPFGMIGSGPTAAVLRYNILFVLAHALLLIGGYALVRQLGAGRTGAAVAGVAFAFAPWRLAQEGQLHLISVGAIPLALAMLARGHGWSLRYGLRPERRHAGWAFAGWMAATWQLILGFSIGLPFAYALAVLMVIVAVLFVYRRIRRRPRPELRWRLFLADLFGPLIFASVGTLLALPYLKVARLYPNATPSAEEIRFFSPPLRSLLISPPESRVWGSAHAAPRASLGWYPEMTLLPGFALYALALAGLLFSVWTVRQRLFLLLGAVVTAILTAGTQFFGGRWTYLPLAEHVPGWDTIRTPGRLILWTTLFLAVLAAGAVAEFVRRAEYLSAQRVPPWPGPWLRLATLVPVLLVLAEGTNVTRHPVVPAQPTALRTVGGPTLVLPTGPLGDQHVLLWSTSRFQPVANGTGSFVPPRQQELRQVSTTFPDVNSIQFLRSRGITTVVLLRDRITGTPWERAGDVPVDALGIQREDLDDAVVFRL
jgi:hypothetical protein